VLTVEVTNKCQNKRTKQTPLHCVTVAVSIFSRIGREINIRSEEEGRTEGERKREREILEHLNGCFLKEPGTKMKVRTNPIMRITERVCLSFQVFQVQLR
jgi:hypothetical protein